MNRRIAFVCALAVLLWASRPEPALCQAVFSGPVNYGGVGAPNDLAAGDVDGDGDQDLVGATAWFGAGDLSITVMFNDGSGLFPSVEKTPLPFSPGDVCLLDMDGDGDLDAAIGTCCYFSPTQVFLLQNDGGGHFSICGSLPSIPSPGIGPSTSGDFNSDGRPDLAITTYTAGSLAVYLNLGGCSFAPAVYYPIGAEASDVCAADLNGDHHLDLAVTNRADGTVTILTGDGLGNFPVFASYATGPEPTKIQAADFDLDGSIDLAISRTTSNVVSVFDNNGLAVFTLVIDLSTPSRGMLGVGDFDLDGYPDIATANYDSHDLSIFANDRAGAFRPRVDYDLGFLLAGWGPIFVCPSDLDRDGDPDLAISHADKVQIMRNLHCGERPPNPCYDRGADLNCDKVEDVFDVIYLIDYVFSGGPPRVLCPQE